MNESATLLAREVAQAELWRRAWADEVMRATSGTRTERKERHYAKASVKRRAATLRLEIAIADYREAVRGGTGASPGAAPEAAPRTFPRHPATIIEALGERAGLPEFDRESLRLEVMYWAAHELAELHEVCEEALAEPDSEPNPAPDPAASLHGASVTTDDSVDAHYSCLERMPGIRPLRMASRVERMGDGS